MMSSAETISRALGGKRSGKNWLCRCPAHNDRNPSLSVTDGSNGKLLVKCWSGCDGRDVLTALRARGLLGDNIGAEQAQKFSNHHKTHDIAGDNSALEWSARAENIWRATIPIIGTPAETYLRGRGCIIPDCTDLRFLPARKS